MVRCWGVRISPWATTNTVRKEVRKVDYKRIAKITLPLVNADIMGLLAWCMVNHLLYEEERKQFKEFVEHYANAVIALAEFVSPEDREQL